MRKPTKKVLNELESIRMKHPRKILVAEDVVDHASNKESVLHGLFEWDNNKAAQAYRLWQARSLIQVCVNTIENNLPDTRVYVSLSHDRSIPKGGYRHIVDILSDPNLRQKMLIDAVGELEAIKEKYEKLKELSGVFTAIKKTGKQVREKLRKEKVLVNA